MKFLDEHKLNIKNEKIEDDRSIYHLTNYMIFKYKYILSDI